MRGPGTDSVQGGRLNDVSAPGQEFGIVGYTHAGGVDRPLVVWKGDDVVVPYTNWSGVYGKGTNTAGGLTSVPIEWPGFKTTAYHRMDPSQHPSPEAERRPVLRAWSRTIADVRIPDRPQGSAARVRDWAAAVRREL